MKRTTSNVQHTTSNSANQRACFLLRHIGLLLMKEAGRLKRLRDAACDRMIRLMDAVLPLDQMTVEEKLSAMEAIWRSLSKHEDQVPVPDWQASSRRAATADRRWRGH